MSRSTLAVTLIPAALTFGGCGRILEYPGTEPERGAKACHDGLDNDFDGAADCADADCTGHCSEGDQVECSDGLDNDGDGLIDAADPRCFHVSSPIVRRCAEQAGVDTVESFDLPAWARVYSSWRRWGLSNRGFIVEGADREGNDRRDPLVAFLGNTTDAAELGSNLGALVRQGPIAGNWQGFELKFSAWVPPGALLRAALVPVDVAPSQDAPLEDTDTALIALTLDGTKVPARLSLDFEGENDIKELPFESSCGSAPCDGRLASVTLSFGRGGFEAHVVFPGGEDVSVRARAARIAAGPLVSVLPASRLVFFGGSVGSDPALLDDLRLRVSPDWPCGFAAPQIPGGHCGVGEALERFGQSVSVARSADGEYCSLVAAGPPAGRTQGGQASGNGIRPATAVTAWRSTDGRTFEHAAVLKPEGSVVGAAILREQDHWLSVLSYRDGDSVRLAFADGASCDAWSELSPGPTLFKDAEAPSYLAIDGQYQVLFTRPPTDQTNRTLWRILAGDPDAVPELVAELPSGVEAPVSITRVGTSDIVLTHPTGASANSPGGVGLLVADGDLRKWEPIGSAPLLELPRGIDLFGGHGRVAFDDRGLVAAALAWNETSKFLLYSGRATGGFPASPYDAPDLAVGTAELALAGEIFETARDVPPPSCGDGDCGALEDCTSCEVDCACGGPRILSDVFAPDTPWELVSTDLAPEAIRYFDDDPPGLSWAGGEPTWSVLPLERAVTGDFELSFDAFVGYVDEFGGTCVLSVGLGTVPDLVGASPPEASHRAGIFVRVVDSTGWFSTLPSVLNQTASLGEGAVSFKDTGRSLENSIPVEQWGHVVLRREGSTVRTLMPAQDGCGFVEKSLTYAGPLGELPALLVGFGGVGFEECVADPHFNQIGTNGRGTIRNLELRLLDDPERCPDGKTRCAAESEEPSCVDRQTSPEHCGTCGRRCTANQICDAGDCVCSDAPGVVACDDGCVDSSTSSEHCGACGNRCPGALGCVGGRCVAQGDCASPFILDPEGETLTLGTSLTMPPQTTLCARPVEDRVVFTWTPARSGMGVVDIDVGETSLDTLLGVTPYPACDAWLVCNDDKVVPTDLGSHIELPVEAGVTYFIGAGVLYRPRVPGETAELSVEVVP